MKSEWKQLEEIEFTRLSKMTYEVPSVSDVYNFFSFFAPSSSSSPPS